MSIVLAFGNAATLIAGHYAGLALIPLLGLSAAFNTLVSVVEAPWEGSHELIKYLFCMLPSAGVFYTIAFLFGNALFAYSILSTPSSV